MHDNEDLYESLKVLLNIQDKLAAKKAKVLDSNRINEHEIIVSEPSLEV